MKTSDFGMPFLLECNSPERCAELCAELKLDFVELNISFPACGIDRIVIDAAGGFDREAITGDVF